MSDHRKAFLPVETWAFSSPILRHAGRLIDIGLLAEALVYYEAILVEPGSQKHFAELVRWFTEQGRFDDLLALLTDGTIVLYHHAFASAPVLDDRNGRYVFLNLQDEVQAKHDTFVERYCEHALLHQVLPNAQQRKRLARAVRDQVVEVKAEDYGAAIDCAAAELLDPNRAARLCGVLLEELGPILPGGLPAFVEAKVTDVEYGKTLTLNVNLEDISKKLDGGLEMYEATIASGAVQINRTLWSAARQGCDLVLAPPMSVLVGDKLVDSNAHRVGPKEIIDQLVARVKYPDLRHLANDGELLLGEILDFRKRGSRFRGWLQDESLRDRDAIVAYHNETARDMGFVRGHERIFRIFGVIGGAGVGAALEPRLGPVMGAMTGAGAGELLSYLVDLARKRDEGWRPVVFGSYLSNRLKNRLK